MRKLLAFSLPLFLAGTVNVFAGASTCVMQINEVPPKSKTQKCQVSAQYSCEGGKFTQLGDSAAVPYESSDPYENGAWRCDYDDTVRFSLISKASDLLLNQGYDLSNCQAITEQGATQNIECWFRKK